MTAPAYLDHAATTPVRPEVLDTMMPFLTEQTFGNPSSAHAFGRAARAAVEESRRRIAAALGCEPREVVFTSGGTESDNLAILGTALAARAAGRPARVAVPATDHKAMLAAAEAVEAMGGEAVVLPVDARGLVSDEALTTALRRGLALLGVLWVNNETGVIQDVAAIGRRCAEAGIPLHVDGVQAVGKVACSVREVGATFFALSGHKVGGPKGVGALIVRNRTALHALLHGGGQQWNLRPGTENVPGIVGLGRAVELAAGEREATAPRLAALRENLERCLRERIPDLTVHGADAPRAPHISNVSIPGTDSATVLMHLDLAGIACSAASACSTGADEPSHVLTAMGVPHEAAAGALRFSLGRTSSAADVTRVVETLPGIVQKARALAWTTAR